MPVDREHAKAILGRFWSETECSESNSDAGSSDEVDGNIRSKIHRLMSSETVAFVYSLPTQLLGKLTDPRLDALCLQRGESSESQWDPRSLATSVVVPWVRDNQNVLGNSPDPYVSNPLRQARVLPDPPNVRPNMMPLWRSLHDVLSTVQVRDDPAYTGAVFRAVLHEAHEMLRRQDFNYPTLQRISLEQTRYLAKRLLESSRQGEHAMSLAAALFVAIGRRFGLWDEVRRQASTASDRAVGSVGDLECRDEGVLVYAVEIKERSLTLGDVRSFEEKLSKSKVTEAIISALGVHAPEADSVDRRIHSMWTRGINLYRLSLEDLLLITMSLAGEECRREFIVEVGEQLDEHALPAGRRAWRDLLTEVLDGRRSP